MMVNEAAQNTRVEILHEDLPGVVNIYDDVMTREVRQKVYDHDLSRNVVM